MPRFRHFDEGEVWYRGMTFESLSTRLTISHEDMWRYMRLLQDRVYGAAESPSATRLATVKLSLTLSADRDSLRAKSSPSNHCIARYSCPRGVAPWAT